MKIRIDILTLLLAVLLSQFAMTLSANDDVEGQNSFFICKSGATIKIVKSSQLVVKSNLIIDSDIIGDGELVMNAEKQSFIDAAGHSIESLVLTSSESVELISGLQIVKKLKIVRGNLFLNAFDLQLDREANVDIETYQRIIQNSIGEIVFNGFQDLVNAIPSHFINYINYNFSQSPILSNYSSSFIPKFCCYITPLVLNRANKVTVPPPKFS